MGWWIKYRDVALSVLDGASTVGMFLLCLPDQVLSRFLALHGLFCPDPTLCSETRACLLLMTRKHASMPDRVVMQEDLLLTGLL